MDNHPNIFVVDDDEDIRDSLTDYLGRFGFRVFPAGGASSLDALMAQCKPQLVILDWMMPGEDGLSICRRLQHSGIPILMLSAMSEPSDRVIGLEMGADDYLPKPFEPRELLARVRALLRRRTKITTAESDRTEETALTFQGWTFFLNQQRLLTPSGNEVALTSGDRTLLEALLKHSLKVLSRDRLIQLTHGDDGDTFDRAIDLAVSRLRRKMENAHAGGGSLIRTIRGDGYRFETRVERQ